MPEIKRTVLGPEDAIVAEWIASIAKEKSKPLRAWGPVFEADLADAANRLFRERGPLAEFVASLVSVRDEAHNKLEAWRLAHPADGLAADWPASFFMAPKRAAPDDAERKAKADARAARKLAAEQRTAARADALQKLREAKAALQALKKK